MMSWSPTPARLAVCTLVDLWQQPEWRSSTHGSTIQAVLRDKLVDADDVNRLHAAQVAVLLEQDDEAGFQLVRERLLAELQTDVATVLLLQLATFTESRPADVDVVIATLVCQDPWSGLLREVRHNLDLMDPLEAITSLILSLAIRHRTPAASKLARGWFDAPASSEAARRAVGTIREWIALPPEQHDERARAFEMLNVAINSLAQLLNTSAGNPDLMKAAYTIVDVIAHDLYFASGAQATGDEQPKPPTQGFAEEAFAALEKLTKFKHPTIIHKIVQTLAHLAPANPAKAFLIVDAAVKPGDRYTYDQLAADETISLIERYFAEFRNTVVTDPELLTAVHSVLHAFVNVGWPAAIALTYRLSDAFR